MIGEFIATSIFIGFITLVTIYIGFVLSREEE